LNGNSRASGSTAAGIRVIYQQDSVGCSRRQKTESGKLLVKGCHFFRKKDDDSVELNRILLVFSYFIFNARGVSTAIILHNLLYYFAFGGEGGIRTLDVFIIFNDL